MSIRYSKNYYKILEIPENATLSTIKKAYHKLALKYHPDKNNTSKLFTEIADAYSVLSDANLRENYNKHYKEIDQLFLYDAFHDNLQLYDVCEYIKNGANINAKNENNQTILMYAANRGNYEMVDFLIKHGADVNEFDKNKYTALIYSAIGVLMKFFPREDIFTTNDETEPEHNSDTKTEQTARNTVKNSTSTIDKDQIQQIEDATNVEKHISFEQKKSFIAKILLDNGANSNWIDVHGNKAIEIAASFANQYFVKLFSLLHLTDEDLSNEDTEEHLEDFSMPLPIFSCKDLDNWQEQ